MVRALTRPEKLPGKACSTSRASPARRRFVRPAAAFCSWITSGRRRIQAARGNLDTALDERYEEFVPFWSEFQWLLMAYRYRRTPDCEQRLAAFLEENADEGAFQIAELYAFADEVDTAFDWLERAVEQRDPGLTDELLSAETLLGLHGDPRWEPLVERLGLLDAYRAMPARALWSHVAPA